MSRTTLATVTRAEFAKFRTARSYVIGLIVLVVLFIGMGILIFKMADHFCFGLCYCRNN